MPSRIQFTQMESERIFASYIPGFRTDSHGRYRGPASYRGGDNPQALSVDTKEGVWFDFISGEGGDVIAFVQTCEGCDFRQACSIITGIIGREVLKGNAKPSAPRYGEVQLLDAELFASGFQWHLERTLARLKADAIRDDKPDARIVEATRLFEQMKTWSVFDAAEYASALKQTDRTLVTGCISEARDFQLQLAYAIAGLNRPKEAA